MTKTVLQFIALFFALVVVQLVCNKIVSSCACRLTCMAVGC